MDLSVTKNDQTQYLDAYRSLDGASILVTGATGSFGQAFIRRVRANALPKRLVVFSRDELKQFEMQRALGEDPRLRFFIGDVRDVNRLEMAFHDIDYVVHAAALKQVSAAEYNPFECIRTNVAGAENVVRAALRAGVKRVVALSTDKAVNPVNLYGASKLASDKIFVAANNLAAGRCSFSIVRYGNVLGSRGSVVPLFRTLLAEGARELPLTDPMMTRFWITIEHGVDFVVSSLAGMLGGEIFVPKIPTVGLSELAEAIAPGVPTRIVGIRPGEKLHEVMITEDDARNTVELSDRYVILPDKAGELRETYARVGARPVAPRFRYASDANADVLAAAQIDALLAGIR